MSKFLRLIGQIRRLEEGSRYAKSRGDESIAQARHQMAENYRRQLRREVDSAFAEGWTVPPEICNIAKYEPPSFPAAQGER